ncbi:MAG TPA: FkbM family methyltransferase [Methanoregulaceae archaeon]|nr:FkbM family methyltransferase [Methanoregulaceae archaeon]
MKSDGERAREPDKGNDSEEGLHFRKKAGSLGDSLFDTGCGPDLDADKANQWFPTRDGISFFRKKTPCRQIFYVPEYRFDDIRKDDIVVDIGANAGAFCIRASRFSDHVIAVEPLIPDILMRNIVLNRSPVVVFNLALGDGSVKEVAWDGLKKPMRTATLKSVIDRAGGCDFLKCDCEGAEWFIRPEDLDGIRRIEMELHIPPICGPPNPALLDYMSRRYEFQLDHVPAHGPMGLMGYLHAERVGNRT